MQQRLAGPFATPWRDQGRRRVFKSGPAEEAIECRRHESGESTRGDHSPSLQGVWGPPPRKFLNFERFYVRFNGFFMRLGPDFSRFGHKDISCRVRNRMLDKIVFRQSHVVFFYFFFFGMFL